MIDTTDSYIQKDELVKIARKQMILEMQMGFIVYDVEGKIVEINELASKYYGSKQAHLYNHTEQERLSGFPPEYYFGERTLTLGIPFRNHTVSWKVGDKNHNFVVDTMLLKDDDKMTIGCCVLIKDISDVKSLELQIQHNERLAMVGQIAAGAAHEIRNPITSIRGFLQFMKKSLVQNDMKKEIEYTEVMISELDRITDLLNEFLLLSKPRDLTITQCNPQEIIGDITPVIAGEAMLVDVDVEYQLNNTPDIRVDRELIKQVFLNIAQNAIEAMSGRGKLNISVDYNEADGFVKFNFKDMGPGIPAYMIDKIFDPFFTTKDMGTGLGLAVCQRIISDLGGQIKVVSKGFGSTFCIMLPAVI